MSEEEKNTGTRPPEASFLIRIQYRQNASWQGTIQWLDQKKTRKFRSELELMMLINEATQTNLVSWKNKEEVS
ncbi:hypothetical protein LPY66_07260 [Dehalobacter sp. DCM]|uniref:hypothetical protein n=1 Tax=Dehalobacter sp. DCM TaxID=2907827 RepID=UPI003081B7C1|nr:hypothetical protein LPY66_07260 [Dehalobacter sp. DCM]